MINAAGPQAPLVGKMVGLELPVDPRRRHIFVTDSFSEIRHPIPLVTDTASGFYCRSEQGAILMSPGDIGAHTEYTASVDWGVLEQTVEKAVRRMPALEDAGTDDGGDDVDAVHLEARDAREHRGTAGESGQLVPHARRHGRERVEVQRQGDLVHGLPERLPRRMPHRLHVPRARDLHAPQAQLRHAVDLLDRRVDVPVGQAGEPEVPVGVMAAEVPLPRRAK